MDVDRDARLWGMLCHLSALLGYSGLPGIGWIVGPLIVWLIKREEYPFVDDQGKEAMNFHISMALLITILVVCSPLTCFLSLIVAIFFAIVQIIFTVIAAINANQGVPYRYPYTIRFIK